MCATLVDERPIVTHATFLSRAPERRPVPQVHPKDIKKTYAFLHRVLDVQAFIACRGVFSQGLFRPTVALDEFVPHRGIQQLLESRATGVASPQEVVGHLDQVAD